MWILPYYIYYKLANLNIHMSAEDKTTLTFNSLRNKDTKSRKRCKYYKEIVNYLSKEYATDQAVSKNDEAIPCYMRPANMNLQEYTINLVPKSWFVTCIKKRERLRHRICWFVHVQ